MSTIIQTPMGIVESGEDFTGNRATPHKAQIEVGSDFQGNAPISTPTAAANIKISG